MISHQASECASVIYVLCVFVSDLCGLQENGRHRARDSTSFSTGCCFALISFYVLLGLHDPVTLLMHIKVEDLLPEIWCLPT